MPETIADHCDRDPSANAYTAWYNPTLRGLVVLCAHHAREHEFALMAQGFELSIDLRDRLLPTPEPA